MEEFSALRNELEARKKELERQIGKVKNAINANYIKHTVKNDDQNGCRDDQDNIIYHHTCRFENVYNEDEGIILFSSKEFEFELVDDRYYVVRKIY